MVNEEFLLSIVKKIATLMDANEVILIDSTCESKVLFFDSSAQLIANSNIPKNRKTAFIIAKNRLPYISPDWKNIYASPEVEIFENIKRHPGIEPLRWGLNKKEQLLALKISRQALVYFLKHKTTIGRGDIDISEKIPEKFYQESTASVSLWKNGILRGCYIFRKNTLIESLLSATQKACRDTRFKPLEKEDLDKITIEICIMSEISVPIVKEDIERLGIYWDKGYKLKYRNKQGWFLPEVFNITEFNNLKNLLITLKKDKTEIVNIPLDDKEIEIETFKVFDFAETYHKKSSVDLINPLAKISCLNATSLWKKITNSADWLLHIQEKDGNFIPIISPDKRKWKQIDWSRSILTALSLSKFGKATHNLRYISAAKLNFQYFYRYIIQEHLENRPIGLAYLGQLAISLKKTKIATECAERILKQDLSKLDTISISQSATLFIEISKINPKFLPFGINLADQVKILFEAKNKERKIIEFAYFAESINNFLQLFKITKNKNYLNFSKKIAFLFIKNQNINGSFKMRTNSFYANTRPTGKLLEVLTPLLQEGIFLDYHEKYALKKSIGKAILWLLSMQYTQDNVHFISQDIKKYILGGMRHHYLDSSLWIDSVSHFLIAMSKIDKKTFSLIMKTEVDELSISFPLKDPEVSLIFKNIKHVDQKIFFHTDYEKINELVPNYSYLLKFLSDKNVILPAILENILVYKKFKDAPGFYEAYLKTNTFLECFARGFSKKWEKCLGQVCGEILERYFHIKDDYCNLLVSSVHQLKKEGGKIIDLNLLSVFSKEQKEKYSNRKWNDNSVFSWELCTNWQTKEMLYIPAQLVYLIKNNCTEPRIRESNSSGLGGFFTPEEAILSGIYELIQRDGYFFHWLNNITPIRIDLKTIKNDEFQNNYRESQKLGFEIVILNLTTDTKIPIFATAIIDASGSGPYYSLGAGCNPDIYKAINRSYEEAWSIYYWSKNKFGGNYAEIPKNYNPFITPINIDERLSIWSNFKMKNKLDFFISNKLTPLTAIKNDYPKKFLDAKEELNFIIKTLKELGKGYEAYVHLADSAMLKKINYYSARVIIPKLIPMYYNEENAPVEHSRIFNKENMNKLLHLFP